MTQTSELKSAKSSQKLHLGDELYQTPEEIAQNGLKAAELLGNLVYNVAYSSVIRNLQDEWLSSQPHETKRRDALYNSASALSLVTQELAAMIVLADELSDDQRTELTRKFS